MSRRIAIVEDEPAIRANYADVLRRQGYEVAAYAKRDEALTAFRTRLPDLALIDIGLGDDVDGGFTLCRELRALSPTVPILFLTARDSDFDVVSGLRLGADDYLTKDVSRPHRHGVRHGVPMERVGRARFALGIRAQLLLVLTVFLVIPFLGWSYVRELERVLRDAQERTLAGTAQAVATALHDRARLFDVT